MTKETQKWLEDKTKQGYVRTGDFWDIKTDKLTLRYYRVDHPIQHKMDYHSEFIYEK